jgi:ClpA/ClpB-like protein
VAAEQHFCDRHHRPAVASRVRILPDGTCETEYLCEIDLAEERMSGRFGSRGLFDDFFSDFFGGSGDGGGDAPTVAPPRRQIEIEFSDDAIELLAREGYDREFGARPAATHDPANGRERALATRSRREGERG